MAFAICVTFAFTSLLKFDLLYKLGHSLAVIATVILNGAIWSSFNFLTA
jgi:hypothetical protein